MGVICSHFRIQFSGNESDAVLRGRFEHTLDSKGRVSIPAKFRDVIGKRYSDTIIVTNFDHCLVAYPLEEWEVVERRAAALPQLKKEVKAFQRFFLSGATECPIDKQGRILVPPSLRQYAGLEREAVLVGLIKRFELWSKERWQQEFAKAQKGFETASEALGELGF